MKIVFVTHLLPYPPNDGGRIGFYNPLKYLSRNHDIVLVTQVDESNAKYIDALKGVSAEVISFVETGTAFWRKMRGVVGRPPGTASKYYSCRFGRLLRETIARVKPDIVEIQHLNSAAYLPDCIGFPVILREHNVEYKVWERQAEIATGFGAKHAMRYLARRVRKYEAEMAPKFARCVMVSEADERYLRDVAPSARILTIPSGVDCEYFQPNPKVEERSFSMVLTGSFSWKPKQHNLRILLTEIYPRIRAKAPKAKLAIVGKGVPPELKQLADANGVMVSGAVEDVRPYVQSASLVLNYLESGGGIALKVLEAMAMRKPVLSNSLGCEGIAVQHGRDVFLADGTAKFADAAVMLLQDARRRKSIADGGYTTVQNLYAWSQLAGAFDQCYRSVLAEDHEARLSATQAV